MRPQTRPLLIAVALLFVVAVAGAGVQIAQITSSPANLIPMAGPGSVAQRVRTALQAHRSVVITQQGDMVALQEGTTTYHARFTGGLDVVRFLRSNGVNTGGKAFQRDVTVKYAAPSQPVIPVASLLTILPSAAFVALVVIILLRLRGRQ